MPAPSAAQSPSVFAIAGLVITGTVLAALLGAAVNGVNCFVSPFYYQQASFHPTTRPEYLMSADDGTMRLLTKPERNSYLVRGAIGLGIAEGLFFGALVSSVFVAGALYFSEGRCGYGTGVRYLLGILVASYLWWVAGGICGVGIATISPNFLKSVLPLPFRLADEALPYCWVAGSMRALYGGGFLVLLLALAKFRCDSLAAVNAAEADDEEDP